MDGIIRRAGFNVGEGWFGFVSRYLPLSVKGGGDGWNGMNMDGNGNGNFNVSDVFYPVFRPFSWE